MTAESTRETKGRRCPQSRGEEGSQSDRTRACRSLQNNKKYQFQSVEIN